MVQGQGLLSEAHTYSKANRGQGLQPKQDISALERIIGRGDLTGQIDGELHIARLKKVADELWLENNHGKHKFQDCQVSAVVIEVVRRLK